MTLCNHCGANVGAAGHEECPRCGQQLASWSRRDDPPPDVDQVVEVRYHCWGCGAGIELDAEWEGEEYVHVCACGAQNIMLARTPGRGEEDMKDLRTPLVVTPVPGTSRRWRLVSPMVYDVPGEHWGEEVVRVPAGFETDFASVPRPLWPVIPPWGKYGEAAVVHDWLYAHPCTEFMTHDHGFPVAVRRTYSRKAADLIFLDIMREMGVRWWRRYTMYWAVRAFSYRAWKRRRA